MEDEKTGRRGSSAFYPRSPGRLGSLEGTGRIVGDIVSPATDDSEWNGLAG